MEETDVSHDLHLALDDSAARTVALRAGRAAEDTPVRKAEVWVLLDTPDGALAAAGLALFLVRRGRDWSHRLVAAAGPVEMAADMALDWPAPGGRVALSALTDRDMRARLQGVLGGAQVSPLARVSVRRTDWALPGGVTLGLDRLALAGPDGTGLARTMAHVGPGGAAALASARALIPQAGERLGSPPSEIVAAALARSGAADPATPRNARPVPMDPGQTVEEAAALILAECAAQVRANVAAVRAGAGSEGPHQLRIGLRRLRATLGLFRDALTSPESQQLAAEARWLGAEVGRLRDLDVIVEDVLLPEAQAHPDEAGFEKLALALRAEGAIMRAGLVRLLAEDRAQGFLIDLFGFVEARGWRDGADKARAAHLTEPVARAGAAALDRRWRKVRRMARHIERLDNPARHELRKELKKLRYSAEFMGFVFPNRRVSRFVKRLKALQEVFGTLNDAATAQAVLGGSGAPAITDPAATRAAGWVIGARVVRAETDWHRARALWRDLEKTRPFWR
jgi:triphosphatase